MISHCQLNSDLLWRFLSFLLTPLTTCRQHVPRLSTISAISQNFAIFWIPGYLRPSLLSTHTPNHLLCFNSRLVFCKCSEPFVELPNASVWRLSCKIFLYIHTLNVLSCSLVLSTIAASLSNLTGNSHLYIFTSYLLWHKQFDWQENMVCWRAGRSVTDCRLLSRSAEMDC